MELIDKIQYREATLEDIEGIIVIENDSFTDSWTAGAFNTCFINPFYNISVATLDDEVIGYGIMKCIYEDGELIRIAIDKSLRGQGIGSAFLHKLIQSAKGIGVEKVFLDVRESNKDAISMYEKLGFERYEVSKGFYREPVEDSIKFRKDIIC